jgi:DNA-binding MarR family transcriptional regulator
MSETDKPVNYGELTNHTGYHIRRAHSVFTRLFSSTGKNFNLRSQQTSILVLTRENPGISPAAIADAIEIERSLMARLLTDLIDRGYITTRPSPEDGRQKGLYITTSGKKFIRRVMDTFYKKLEPALTGNLTPKEKQTLIKLLAKIYQSES